MKKSEIIAKEKATKDLAFLSKMANRNLFAKNNGEHELLMNDAVTWYQAGLIPEQDMYMYLYLYYLSTCLYRYTQQQKDDEQQPLHNWEIDTGRLKPGDMFPNYKKLCEHLGVQPKSGKGRKLQEDIFRRYFDYQKVEGSQTIIIMDVYSEPQDRTEYRNAKFINQIKVLIMRELWKQCNNPKYKAVDYKSVYSEDRGSIDDDTIIINTSFTKLILDMGLVNRYFFKREIALKYFLKAYPTLFDYNHDMGEYDSFAWNYQMFFSITLTKIKSAIRDALKSLNKDDILSVDYNYMIILPDHTRRIATSSECAALKAIRFEIAKEMGYKNSYRACFYKPREFKLRFKSKISEKYNWYDVYYGITISTKFGKLLREIHEYTALPSDYNVAELNTNAVSFFSSSFQNEMLSAVIEKAKEERDCAFPERADFVATALKENESNDLDDCSIDDIKEIYKIEDSYSAKRYTDSYCERRTTLANVLIPTSTEVDIEQTVEGLTDVCAIAEFIE